MFKRFILLFIVWIGLTNSLDIQELILGAIVSVVIVYVFINKTNNINFKDECIKYFKFIPLFIKNLIVSNIEIAKIVLNPKLPINPKIIKLDFIELNDIDKLLIANAVTLTPGTITLDVTNTHIYIHVLNLKTDDKNILKDMILSDYIKCCKRN
jgi:multicomponent Na+:H+ antiporter subunit E